MSPEITEAPDCGHCGAKMVKYDLPPVAFSDGLGWGSPFLWICPSDDCPIFRRGFEHTLNNYGQTSSMRSIVEPDSGRGSVIPALSVDSEHFKFFVEKRKEIIKDQGKKVKPENRTGDDEDDWPDEDIYDPSMDFTGK